MAVSTNDLTMYDRRAAEQPYNNVGLVSRIGAPAARYVRLVAPAGFGKSMLIRAFAQQYSDAAIEYYDCRDIAGVTVAPHLARVPRGLPDGVTHVFDHLEAILSDDRPIDSVTKLLRLLAPNSRAILLSRCPLPATLFYDAAPHEIVDVNHHDLQFDTIDVHREFAGAMLSEGSIAEIMRVTRGWPAAVLFLRQLIRNEDDVSLLLDLTGSALRIFHEYVVVEVLKPLSPSDFETLIACATLPHASIDDVAAALGIESADARLDELTAAFPLIGYHANATIALHPLVLAALKAKHEGLIERSIARAIDAHTQRGAPLATARMYLELGRLDEAAEALGLAQIDFQSTQQTFEELSAQLDDTVVCASPALWTIMFPFRRYRHDPRVLLLEAERLLSSPLLIRTSPIGAAITASAALLLCDLGEFDRALFLCTVLEELAIERGVNVDAYTKMAQAVVMSHKGNFSESIALWQRAGLSMSFSAFPTSRQLQIEARAARAQGRFDIESELHRRHLSLARRSGTAAFEGMVLAEAAFSAWLAGRDDLVLQHAATYRGDVPRVLGYSFNGFFRSVFAQQDEPIEIQGPLPYINAYSGLVRSGIATDGMEKIRYARLAKAAADQSHDGFLRILSRVTLSYLEPAHRACHLQESVAIARSIESHELTAALRALVPDPEAEAGMLEPLARRFRRGTSGRSHAALCIHVLEGRVTRNGATVAISEGTMALLVALALEQKPSSRERLGPLLWPDSEPEEVGNALKMRARRLRAQLNDYGIIDWSAAGYSLRSDTVIDIEGILPTAAAALGRKCVLPEEAVALRSVFEALSAGRPTFMTAWEWFEPTERRLCSMAHELGVLLATAAFEREDDAECLAVSRRLLAADVCDETAHELRIRMCVRAGDRAAASREFCLYKSVLKKELGGEPGPEFQTLVEGLIG
jgi:DNA-binding SARP family transcriptional activator